MAKCTPHAGLVTPRDLITSGACTVPCLSMDDLPDFRSRFLATCKSFPEFDTVPPNNQFVLGGFSALGNPASFHNPLVRELRQRAMRAAVTQVWSKVMRPDEQLEQIIDRMMLRPAGVTPTSETWHRDEAPNAKPHDDVYGGWINLDSEPQYLHCVLKSHKEKANKKGKGFHTIAKELHAGHRSNCRAVQVPPGHLLIFYEHLIHEVVSKKRSKDSYRLFTGWRVTPLHERSPLLEDQETFENLLTTQAVMRLKSNQLPPMYATLHWTNWRSKLQEFSAHLKPACKTTRVVGSGQHKGRGYYVVERHMRSLSDYGLKLYKPYTANEIALHLPSRGPWQLDQAGGQLTLLQGHGKSVPPPPPGQPTAEQMKQDKTLRVFQKKRRSALKELEHKRFEAGLRKKKPSAVGKQTSVAGAQKQRARLMSFRKVTPKRKAKAKSKSRSKSKSQKRS